MKAQMMRFTILIIIASLFLSSCGLIGGNTPEVQDPAVFFTQAAMTMSVDQTLAALSVLQNQPTATMIPPTDTPEPTPTIEVEMIEPTIEIIELATETPEPTPTPDTPMLNVVVNTNCRAGPSLMYRVEGYITTDLSLPVRGVNEGRSWWWVDNPTYPGYHCWVNKNTSEVVGDISMVPVYRAPWTPTPGTPKMSVQIVTGPTHVEGKCPLKVKFGAIIKSNTGGYVRYEWIKKGKNKTDKGWVNIPADGQATLMWSFTVNGDGDQWVRLWTYSPVRMVSNTYKFTVDCKK